jgi:cell division septation protein DedD
MRLLRAALLACALPVAASAAVAPNLQAQDPPSLDRVEELTALGRTEEARELLLVWWDHGRPAASRRDLQRGLWLRGQLTVDPRHAVLDYRRLTVEYPGGPFSARALFRLAQTAWELGDPATADVHLAQLDRSHPGSPTARKARSWRAGRGAPSAVPEGASPAAGGPGRPPTRETGPRPDVASAADPPWAVQLGAFLSDDRARTLRERAAAAGYATRLVRVEGSRLLRVRVGRFPAREEAERLLEEIRAGGLEATLVRDVHREVAPDGGQEDAP